MIRIVRMCTTQKSSAGLNLSERSSAGLYVSQSPILTARGHHWECGALRGAEQGSRRWLSCCRPEWAFRRRSSTGPNSFGPWAADAFADDAEGLRMRIVIRRCSCCCRCCFWGPRLQSRRHHRRHRPLLSRMKTNGPGLQPDLPHLCFRLKRTRWNFPGSKASPGARVLATEAPDEARLASSVL